MEQRIRRNCCSFSCSVSHYFWSRLKLSSCYEFVIHAAFYWGGPVLKGTFFDRVLGPKNGPCCYNMCSRTQYKHNVHAAAQCVEFSWTSAFLLPRALVSEAPLRNLRASGPFTQHTAQSGHAPQFSHSAVLQQSESRALGLEPNSTQLPQLVSTNSELGLQLSKHKNWLLMPLRHPAVALVKASWLETLHKHSKRPQSSH